QAEDGIRAFHVTGVQTCALPIFRDRETLSCVASGGQSGGRWCRTSHHGGFGSGYSWAGRESGHADAKRTGTPHPLPGKVCGKRKIGRASGRERGGVAVVEGAGRL